MDRAQQRREPTREEVDRAIQFARERASLQKMMPWDNKTHMKKAWGDASWDVDDKKVHPQVRAITLKFRSYKYINAAKAGIVELVKFYERHWRFKPIGSFHGSALHYSTPRFASDDPQLVDEATYKRFLNVWKKMVRHNACWFELSERVKYFADSPRFLTYQRKKLDFSTYIRCLEDTSRLKMDYQLLYHRMKKRNKKLKKQLVSL